MTNRHNVTRMAAIAGAAALLFGCFGAHGRDGEESGRRDAGTLPDPDGGIAAVDAATVPPTVPPTEPVTPPAPACGTLDRDVSVRIETLGRRPCDAGRYDDSILYAIERAPDGIVLRVDTCPLADDDCRCGVTVTGISADAAAELTTRGGELVTVVLAEDGVLIEETEASCVVDDHTCVPGLVFAAANGTLEPPPIDPRALDFRWGEVSCSVPSDDHCVTETYEVVVMSWVSGFPGAIGSEQTVHEGPPVVLDHDGLAFELVRSTVVTCPDERRVRTASWAAWRTF